MKRMKHNIGMEGFFRFQTRNKDTMEVTQDTGWFPNTILNNGRNVMASRGDWMTWCQVGTDGTFPATLPERQVETSLGNHYAGTNLIVTDSISNGQAGTDPEYYGWKRKTWRFPEDTFTGGINLSEAGVGWGVDGDQLISRAPILDPILQTPTTVTPLANEILDVSYELRYYSPRSDVLGPQITLNGIVYDTTTRAAKALNAIWSEFIGDQIGFYNSYGDDWLAYDGTIGTVLLSPNGNASTVNSTVESNSAYLPNSYELQMSCSISATSWNLGAGIRSINIFTTAGSYQTEFSSNPGLNPIPKTDSYTMNMSWTISWAELPPAWVAGTYSLGDQVRHNNIYWESDINGNTSEPGVANWTQF